MRYNILTAQEAAALIQHDECVGMGGFTAAGVPKAVTAALAERAKQEHAAGRPFSIRLMTGASTGRYADGLLAEADAISMRMPYMSAPELRSKINRGEVHYSDIHLSQVAAKAVRGDLPRIDTLILEASAINDEGQITLTTSIGNAPAYCKLAKRIIVELNSYHKPELRELHDIYLPENSLLGGPLPLRRPQDRIGKPYIQTDPERIVGVVYTNEPDHIASFKPGTEQTERIGERIAKLLEKEIAQGHFSADELILQSGVGNIADAVLGAIGRSSAIPPITMYTEVMQDSVVRLMRQGRCLFASSCSLTVSDTMLAEIYANWEFFRDKIVLRPAEISNAPAITCRLGLVCINTAIEVDIFGNVNSSHIGGTHIMNGIGGSADFSRTAALTIFSCPSIQKGGDISSIVPMVSHTDHTEHDVDIVVTEQGVADLRGKSPRERAEIMIEQCAHPSYRELLRSYLRLSPMGHTPHCLGKAFEMHEAYRRCGSMLHADFSQDASGRKAGLSLP